MRRCANELLGYRTRGMRLRLRMGLPASPGVVRLAFSDLGNRHALPSGYLSRTLPACPPTRPCRIASM